MHGQRSILYIAPTFLADRTRKQIRGVQVLDFQIIADLLQLGHRVCVPIERTWLARFREQLGPLAEHPGLEIVTLPHWRKPTWTTIAAAWKLRNRRFDAVIVGNVARGLLAGLSWMIRRRISPRLVIQANARPKGTFLRVLRHWPARVVAVSRHVAEGFPPQVGIERRAVDVYYGICNPNDFFPAKPSSAGAPIRLCMLGKLDTPLKGVDRVIEAFKRLPPDVRDRCELHLASFPSPPAPETIRSWGPGVVAHPWMPPQAVPELLRSMDALVIASDSETYSQACVQAMLTGIPVISRDLPALREKLESGAGLLYRTGEELGEAISRVVLNPDERNRMGEYARSFALAHCVWRTEEFLDRYVFADEPRMTPA